MQRRRIAEGIHEGGVGIGHEQHVGFMNRLPAANGAAVEAKALLERALFQFADRVADVLPEARKIGKAEVQDFCVVFWKQIR